MTEEPDDISEYDFTSVRPKPPVRSTGRTPVPRQQSRRTPTLFTKAIRDYIDSLPRGEKQYAENTIRLYMTGPAQLDAAEALERFMERRGRDAQAPVGATEFDDSGDEDQDIGEFEPSGGGLNGGALSDGLQVLIDDADWSAANPQLYGRLIDRMGMSRTDEISKRTRGGWSNASK